VQRDDRLANPADDDAQRGETAIDVLARRRRVEADANRTRRLFRETIDRSAGERRCVPEEQAAPAETAIPSRSRAITTDSAWRPGR